MIAILESVVAWGFVIYYALLMVTLVVSLVLLIMSLFRWL